jgi:hypothetical protein
MTLSAAGSTLTQAHRPTEVTDAESSNAQEAGRRLVARFQNMPISTAPSSGAMKKLKSAWT